MTAGSSNVPGQVGRLPLTGIRVLDFSTLVPGPLATLLLAEAGASVIKVERPGAGDELRRFEPKLGDASAVYAMLNRGKRVVAADLKQPGPAARVRELARDADVIVEQFRPGVASRLGIGYDDVRALNPGVVYCSITGYGQEGPRAGQAGHDLNFLAESGLLWLVTAPDGTPAMPFTVLADIAGGAYPAVLNILLRRAVALEREQAGGGLRERGDDEPASGQGVRADLPPAHDDHRLPFRVHAKRYRPRGQRSEA